MSILEEVFKIFMQATFAWLGFWIIGKLTGECPVCWRRKQ